MTTTNVTDRTDITDVIELFIAVGEGGKIFTAQPPNENLSQDSSLDLNWVTIENLQREIDGVVVDYEFNLNAITIGNGVAVAVGQDGAIFHSVNGVIWDEGYFDGFHLLRGYNGELSSLRAVHGFTLGNEHCFLACSDKGEIIWSSDALLWRPLKVDNGVPQLTIDSSGMALNAIASSRLPRGGVEIVIAGEKGKVWSCRLTGDMSIRQAWNKQNSNGFNLFHFNPVSFPPIENVSQEDIDFTSIAFGGLHHRYVLVASSSVDTIPKAYTIEVENSDLFQEQIGLVILPQTVFPADSIGGRGTNLSKSPEVQDSKVVWVDDVGSRTFPNLRSVVYNSQTRWFVAAGENGHIFRSWTGSSWQVFGNSNFSGANTVFYGAGHYFVAGQGGRISHIPFT